MNSLLAPEMEKNDGLKTQILLKSVLAYEDYLTGTRAKVGLDKVTQGLGNQFAFYTSSWKFSVLDVADLREIAASEAAEADILVIAAYEGRDLPQSVHAWIDSWTLRRNEGGCLLAVLMNEEGPLQPVSLVCEHLRVVAAKAGMDFLTQKIKGPHPEIEVAPPSGDKDQQQILQCWANFLSALRLPEPK